MARIDVTRATGSGAIAASYSPPSGNYRLESVTITFNTAPATSENLTVTLDSAGGADYDSTLVNVNPSVEDATSIVYLPEGEVDIQAPDAIDVAFTNTDGRTYGVEIKAKKIT